MTEPTQYTFDLHEVTVALVKQQGLHEGRWMLSVMFAQGAGMIGLTPDQNDLRPTAFNQVTGIQLVRPPEGTPNAPFVVDAGKVNPRPTPRKARQASSTGG